FVLASKQNPLLPRSSELRTINTKPFMLETIFFCVGVVLVIHHFCNATFTTHSNAPPAVIHFAVMAAFYKVPHLVGAVRKIFVQPVVKKKFDGAIQPDKCVGRK